jgi:hypothetical protein
MKKCYFHLAQGNFKTHNIEKLGWLLIYEHVDQLFGSHADCTEYDIHGFTCDTCTTGISSVSSAINPSAILHVKGAKPLAFRQTPFRNSLSPISRKNQTPDKSAHVLCPHAVDMLLHYLYTGIGLIGLCNSQGFH